VKRGLVVRDSSEIADSEWDARVGVVQSVMATRGLDYALVYGDVFRSDDIGYLTNLCIYWNEGVVAVPASGAPILLTKLSPRVHTWMRRTSTMTDLRSGKTFGDLVAKLVGDDRPGAVGLVDADLWPALIVDELRESIPDWELRLLGSTIRDRRAFPSPAEIELLRRGSAILIDAIDAAAAPGLSTTDRVALLERHIRGGGFTDTAIETAVTDDGVVTLQATGEYRHGWPHVSRVVATGVDAQWPALLSAGLAAAITSLRADVPWEDVVQSAADELTGLPSGATWKLRCVNQADMATAGELLSAEHEQRTPEAGEVVILSIEVVHPGHTRSVVADTLLVTADGAEVLTA
jgi:Xaa-Pro aminopeptidase